MATAAGVFVVDKLGGGGKLTWKVRFFCLVVLGSLLLRSIWKTFLRSTIIPRQETEGEAGILVSMLGAHRPNLRLTSLYCFAASCGETGLPVLGRLGHFTPLNHKSPHFLLPEPFHCLTIS